MHAKYFSNKTANYEGNKIEKCFTPITTNGQYSEYGSIVLPFLNQLVSLLMLLENSFLIVFIIINAGCFIFF